MDSRLGGYGRGYGTGGQEVSRAVPDECYRFVGQCARLQSLVLMYCRETGDRATKHIAALPDLKKYFASYNLIRDRTPEILSGMDTLESVAFSACSRLTNAGVATLARLPRLPSPGVASSSALAASYSSSSQSVSALRSALRARWKARASARCSAVH